MSDFAFERGRGIVWVSDLAASSALLNSDSAVEDFERFLPRFYWFSDALLSAAGGRVVKWTGDGFLGWIPLRLDREKPGAARAAYTLAWHLTVLVNVTQMGLDPTRRFRLRHGVTYEPDGLLLTRHSESGVERDVIGRDVVLAFRLAGVPSEFPFIVTPFQLAQLAGPHGSIATFEEWEPSEEEILTFFKGEDRGAGRLARSTKPVRPLAHDEARADAQRVVRALHESEPDEELVQVFMGLQERVAEGPGWAEEVLKSYLAWLREDVVAPLVDFVQLMKKWQADDKGGAV